MVASSDSAAPIASAVVPIAIGMRVSGAAQGFSVSAVSLPSRDSVGYILRFADFVRTETRGEVSAGARYDAIILASSFISE